MAGCICEASLFHGQRQNPQKTPVGPRESPFRREPSPKEEGDARDSTKTLSRQGLMRKYSYEVGPRTSNYGFYKLSGGQTCIMSVPSTIKAGL